MDDNTIIHILQTYSDSFSLNTYVNQALREVGWIIIKLLAMIVDGMSGVVDKLFVLDSFYNNTNVTNFINSFRPVIVVLFGISFCIIGYELMFLQKKQFRQIAVNLLIALSVIIILPAAMDKVSAITGAGIKSISANPTDMANDIIKSNVVDLKLYDKANFNAAAIKQLTSSNKIDKNNIRYINMNDYIDPSEDGIQNPDVFKNELIVDVDGKIIKDGLNKGFFNVWKDYYFRYSLNFFNIIIALLVSAVTLIFVALKLGRIIFELAYNKLFAILIAPIDVSSGQRTKKILQNIISMFAVTFFVAILLKFYVLFVAVCANEKGLVWLILLASGSYAVIDGPNIVEKILGIDAGLNSGVKTMLGAKAAIDGIKGAGKGIANGAKAIAHAPSSAANSIRSFATSDKNNSPKGNAEKVGTNKEQNSKPKGEQDKNGDNNYPDSKSGNTDNDYPKENDKSNGSDGSDENLNKDGNENEKEKPNSENENSNIEDSGNNEYPGAKENPGDNISKNGNDIGNNGYPTSKENSKNSMQQSNAANGTTPNTKGNGKATENGRSSNIGENDTKGSEEYPSEAINSLMNTEPGGDSSNDMHEASTPMSSNGYSDNMQESSQSVGNGGSSSSDMNAKTESQNASINAGNENSSSEEMNSLMNTEPGGDSSSGMHESSAPTSSNGYSDTMQGNSQSVGSGGSSSSDMNAQTESPNTSSNSGNESPSSSRYESGTPTSSNGYSDNIQGNSQEVGGRNSSSEEFNYLMNTEPTSSSAINPQIESQNAPINSINESHSSSMYEPSNPTSSNGYSGNTQGSSRSEQPEHIQQNNDTGKTFSNYLDKDNMTKQRQYDKLHEDITKHDGKTDL